MIAPVPGAGAAHPGKPATTGPDWLTSLRAAHPNYGTGDPSWLASIKRAHPSYSGVGTRVATPSAPAATGSTPSYGTESGPGILESWFNQRANGTDPGYEYATKRGLTSLDNRYAAGGSFNSGAARQGESDFLANMAAQREGQLDSLAGGASGEHQGRVNSMFNQGLGIAGGESGLAGSYDTKAADALSNANLGALMLGLQKAGVDSQAAQALINNILGAVALAK